MTGEPARDTGTFVMARIAFLLAAKLDPKPLKIRHIRRICSCSQKSAEYQPNVDEELAAEKKLS